MSPVVILGLGGLVLAGAGLYIATRHEPTPRERLVDAVLTPIEGVSGALSWAPYLPLIMILGALVLLGLVIFAIAPALPGMASAYSRAGR